MGELATYSSARRTGLKISQTGGSASKVLESKSGDTADLTEKWLSQQYHIDCSHWSRKAGMMMTKIWRTTTTGKNWPTMKRTETPLPPLAAGAPHGGWISRRGGCVPGVDAAHKRQEESSESQGEEKEAKDQS